MMRRVRARSVALFGAIVVAMALAWPGAAYADEVDYDSKWITIYGHVDVVGDWTDWRINATLRQTARPGECAYLEINVDRNNWTDPDFRTPNFCLRGDGAFPWAETHHFRFTRGARLKLCWQHTGCEQIQYIRER